MLSSHYSHYDPPGIARRRLWPGSACAWSNLAVFPFYAFFSPPATALRGLLPGGGNVFTLASRFARMTMHNTNTTPLTAEETRPGRNSNDTGFYLPDLFVFPSEYFKLKL